MTGRTHDDRRIRESETEAGGHAATAASTATSWYTLALLPPAFTVLPSLVDTAFVTRPPLFTVLSILAVLLGATTLGFSRWSPDPGRLFVLGVLATVLFEVVAVLTLTPGRGAVAGSLVLVTDVALTWTVAYGLAGALVYGFGVTDRLRRREVESPMRRDR
jgi:hypothetical protein